MPYTTPTAADFRARYPEFTAVGDTTINAMILEAEYEVGPSWIDQDRRPAVLALTAHWLALEGEPLRTTSEGGGGGGGTSTQVVTRVKVGDVETYFSDAAATTAGQAAALTGSAAGYMKTVYGQRYYQLLRRSFPGVAIV